MQVVGIVGGVASGKSLVACRLVELGAALIDGDATGHDVLCEPDVIGQIVDRWGTGVLDADGAIDRSAVACRVFATGPGGAEDLVFLEAIMFPRIRRLIEDQIETWRAAGDIEVAVVDAAVMFKAGWDRNCDIILFVDAPRVDRLSRAQSRGWTEQQFSARERAQVALETKRREAGAVIDNSGAIAQTYAQTEQFWQSLD